MYKCKKNMLFCRYTFHFSDLIDSSSKNYIGTHAKIVGVPVPFDWKIILRGYIK